MGWYISANGSVNVRAQYSVAFETKIVSSLYPDKGYCSHFKAANTALAEECPLTLLLLIQ